MILIWVLLIFALIYFVKYLTDRNRPDFVRNSNKNALQILKERYAMGEINREQFESMKKDLGE